MNYAEQRRFLDRYSRVWTIGAAAVLVSAWLATRTAGRPGGALLVAAGVVAATLWYQPKYLHLHNEVDKRYAWAVRSRWILIVAIGIVAAVWNRGSREGLTLTAGAVVWLLVVNAAVMVLFKRERVLKYGVIPYVYLAGDAVLWVTLRGLGIDGSTVAPLVFLSLEFFLVLIQSATKWIVPLVILAINVVGPNWLVRTTAATVVLLAGLLVNNVVYQARRNYEETVSDISAFLGFSREETAQRLVNSGRQLAESWTAAKLDENDKAGIARWYSENSLPYLFDIARFHVRYKHIVFTLDVLEACRGRCLDYGAGKGELAIELARRRHAVTYYDVPGTSRQYAEWNAKRNGLTLVFASQKEEIRAEAAHGNYDTILSLDVLEHLPDLASELEFLSSVLSPGGKMILTVPKGATANHPMHLSHDVSAEQFLKARGFRDAKTWKQRWLASELLRKPYCVIVEEASQNQSQKL